MLYTYPQVFDGLTGSLVPRTLHLQQLLTTLHRQVVGGALSCLHQEAVLPPVTQLRVLVSKTRPQNNVGMNMHLNGQTNRHLYIIDSPSMYKLNSLYHDTRLVVNRFRYAHLVNPILSQI